MEKEEDRLSSLPDCLIHEIISRLPKTKYAIRTGTLSKRWQHLWTQVPNLYFNIDYRNLFVDTRVQSLINFYSSVDKIITQRGHLNLNKFKLHTQYFIEFESLVNKWIHSLVKCNTQELDLFLEIPVYEGGFVLDSESFSNNSCFSKLKLNDCQFNPRGTFRWKKLRSLSITYAELNDHLIQNILSGSPVLETFKLKRCYGFSRMDITSKSLKNLVLSGYNSRNSDAHIIQVNAPNIWSLTIQSFLDLWKLLLVDVSCLVKAHLDYTKYGHYETTRRETEEDMLKGLILSLRHVKELTIGDSCQTVLSRLKAQNFTFPSNLKS